MERVLRNEQEVEKEPGRRRALSVQASLMTPVQPMLVRLLLQPRFVQMLRPSLRAGAAAGGLGGECGGVGAGHGADAEGYVSAGL